MIYKEQYYELNLKQSNFIVYIRMHICGVYYENLSILWLVGKLG